MPRKKCARRICHTPTTGYFKPAGIPLYQLQEVTLEIDEFEAIRLADRDGLYQEDAARQMGISRQTFGRILSEAHRKIATALTYGLALRINHDPNIVSECNAESDTNINH